MTFSDYRLSSRHGVHRAHFATAAAAAHDATEHLTRAEALGGARTLYDATDAACDALVDAVAATCAGAGYDPDEYLLRVVEQARIRINTLTTTPTTKEPAS